MAIALATIEPQRPEPHGDLVALLADLETAKRDLSPLFDSVLGVRERHLRDGLRRVFVRIDAAIEHGQLALHERRS